jgi:hypothetical protein
MADRHWTHEELKGLLEKSSIADLEKLIATPGHKYREQFAHSYAINALRKIAESDVLPEDIRVPVQRVLELHEQASDPFLGMDLSGPTKESEDPALPGWAQEKGN